MRVRKYGMVGALTLGLDLCVATTGQGRLARRSAAL